MKSVSKMVMGALLVGMSATAFVAPAMAQRDKKEAKAEEWKPKLGNDFRKAFPPVSKALDAKDFAAATAALPALEAAATTPDEKYVVGQIMLQIGSNTKDEAMQRKAIDQMVLSGAGPQSEVAKLNFYRGNFAYKANDFPTAITALTAAEQGGYQGTDLQLLLAESYFKSKQVPTGLAAVEKAIAMEKAAGRVAPQDWYARAASVSYQNKLAPEVAKWTRLQLEAYPSAENWRSALVIYRDNSNLDQGVNLDILRLMRASKALTSERDYYEYAQLAADRGLPGEAKTVIEEGRAAAVFEKSNANINEIYTAASNEAKSDRASLASSEKQAASAANGKIALGTADAYLAYGDYAKAAALYRTAIEKGGIDNDLANTRMGIALARSGQKDAAKAAFQAVTGPRAELAKFWTLWVDQSA
jgi:hypothetical protein